MIVLSSQRYLNEDTVEAKKAELVGVDEVELPIVFVGEFEGESLFVLLDKHHTMAAAKELGVPTSYTEIERRDTRLSQDDSLEDCLDTLYMDADWYNVETGRDYF